MTTSQKIRIVCISNTHNASPGSCYTIPPGDILIHAGDLTNNGQTSEIRKALAWLREANYEHKIVVAGNHDRRLDSQLSPNQPDADRDEEAAQLHQAMREDDKITYLEHESTVISQRHGNQSLRLAILASNGFFNAICSIPTPSLPSPTAMVKHTIGY